MIKSPSLFKGMVCVCVCVLKKVGIQIHGYGHQLAFTDPAHQHPSNKVKSYAHFCEGWENDRNDMQRVAHTKFYA